MLAYFIDDNVYNREGDAFWVKGESSADILLRAPIEPEATSQASQARRSLRDREAHGDLETGPKPNRVTIRTGSDERVDRYGAELAADVELEMTHGVPYKYRSAVSDQLRLHAEHLVSTGFVPMFENGANDSRFLGVMVRLCRPTRSRQ